MYRSLIFLYRFEELINQFKSNSHRIGIVNIRSIQQQNNHNIKQSLVSQQFYATSTKHISVLGNVFQFHSG